MAWHAAFFQLTVLSSRLHRNTHAVPAGRLHSSFDAPIHSVPLR